VQAHLAEPEPFDDEGFIADWAEAMRAAGLAFELHRYPGAGHYFTDATLPDHDPAAAALAEKRVLAFLARL
jgi:dienelactone hydrolase